MHLYTGDGSEDGSEDGPAVVPNVLDSQVVLKEGTGSG